MVLPSARDGELLGDWAPSEKILSAALMGQQAERRDQRRRNFVTVALPGDKLHLVFRNPGSRATADWRPSKSPIAITAPVLQLRVVIKPAVLVVAQAKAPTVNADTGDAELDALFNELGR